MIWLWNRDMRAFLTELPDACIDCVIADPPYGETSLEWDRWVDGWPALVHRVLKPSGSMWVFGSTRMFLMKRDEFFPLFKLSHDVIWEKQNGSGFFNDRFRRVHELALHFYRADTPWKDVFKTPQFTLDATARTVRRKGRPAQWTGARGDSYYESEDGGPRLARSVQFVRNCHGNSLHPTQKPVEIIEPLLLYACPEHGAVLDPFMGSGSVGEVAAKHSRKFIGIEVDTKFYAVARARLAGAAAIA